MFDLSEYSIWVDVMIFSIIAIILLLILLCNHFYLQFITAIIMIALGIALFINSWFEPSDYYKDWIISAIKDDKNKADTRQIINLIFKNKLLINAIHLTIVFSVFFWIGTISYFLAIRGKYIIIFSTLVFKQNWWKIFYIPIILGVIGVYWLVAANWIGEKTVNKSHFGSFIKITKLEELFPEKGLKKSLDTIEINLKKITKKNKDDPKTKIALVRLVLEVKNGLDVEKGLAFKKEWEELEKVDETKALLNSKNEDVSDELIHNKIQKDPELKKLIDKNLNSNEFWTKKDQWLKLIKQTKENGVFDIEENAKELTKENNK